MKKPNDEDRRLAEEANILARLAIRGDKTAKRKLDSIIQTNWYVAKLVSSLRIKISQLEAKHYKIEKRSTQRLQGGVMHGLSNITSSRRWKTTK